MPGAAVAAGEGAGGQARSHPNGGTCEAPWLLAAYDFVLQPKA